jgi:resuscitation-promoting factor RpfB
MRVIYLRSLGLIFCLLGLALLGLGWRKSGSLANAIDTAQPSQVRIQVDGEARTVTSLERLPANLLSLAGVRLFPGDQLLADGLNVAPDAPLPPATSHSLQVRRAVLVTLQDGPRAQSFLSTAFTLGQALSGAGITLHVKDRLTLSPETLLTTPLHAGLERSVPLTIQLQDGEVQFRSTAPTVGEALAESGLALQGLDYSQPPAASPLPPDGQIRLVRVQEVVTVEQEPIPFKTEQQPAPEVELDTRKILQAGALGLKAHRVRTRYEDGIEVSQAVEGEWTALEPKTQIIGYGTKVVIRTLNTPDGPIQYWRTVQMYATSYSPCRVGAGQCSDTTATGAKLQKGIVAMTNGWCRSTCGSKVYVPGYGVGLVADTGGGVPGRYWIDLGYSESDFVNWHQSVTVYFLTPVPANVMWVLP